VTIRTVSRREVIEIPLEVLDDGTNVRTPSSHRRGYGVADVGLAASIAELGVLQPITVCRSGGRFTVLYGHRRTAAARRAGHLTIPAIVEPEPDHKPIRQLVENQHRLQVNPIDIARTLRAYLDENPGTKQHDLARMLGRSTYWISTKLALLEMQPQLQEAVAGEKLSQGLAIAAHKASTAQEAGRGRPRVFRIDGDHLDGENAHSASVVVPLPATGAKGTGGKATISVERGEAPSIELVLEDGSGHGVMLTLHREAARMLGHRLMQAYQATAVPA
jgi:ParB/RepB/Spo0J family partition protein